MRWNHSPEMQAKYCKIVSCSSWFQKLQNCEPLLQNLKLISIFTEVKYTPDKLVRSGWNHETLFCLIYSPDSYRDLGFMFFLEKIASAFRLIFQIDQWHDLKLADIDICICDMFWNWMTQTHLSFGEYSFSSPQHFWNFSCDNPFSLGFWAASC